MLLTNSNQIIWHQLNYLRNLDSNVCIDYSSLYIKNSSILFDFRLLYTDMEYLHIFCGNTLFIVM